MPRPLSLCRRSSHNDHPDHGRSEPRPHQLEADKGGLQSATGFTGDIKRSKIYDPPEWDAPSFSN